MKERTKLILAFTVLLVTWVLVMVGTGFGTYFLLCREVEKPVDSSALLLCNCAGAPKCNVTRVCPLELAEPCPTHPLMPTTPSPTACIKPCQPVCNAENCLVTLNCPATPEPTVAYLIRLSHEQIQSKTVLEWVKTYPANSHERLQVITQLLDYGIEPYVQTMTRRSCKNPFRVCALCHDRYAYIRCVMKTNVVQNKYGFAPTNKLSRMSSWFASNFPSAAHWHSWLYKNYLTRDDYKPMIDTVKAFSLVAADGTECELCRDILDPTNHMNCILNGSD